ncbi:MAG: hypothetical protein EB060_08690 [Proteobacteria bacterium]|nr:hypothetical protein [Pseudomonadota bacterium]
MADNSEKFEFDVETGKLKRAIEDISSKLRMLYKEMSALSKQGGQWSDKQNAEFGQMGQMAAKYKAELANLKQQYDSLLGSQQKGIAQNRMYAQSTRDLNVIFLSLGYAIDDFLTVWSLRSNSIEGILAGAGAAANNFSVILAQILPGQTKILAFLPALAVAVAKVGYSFYKTGEDADEFQKKIEKNVEHMKALNGELLVRNIGQDQFNMVEQNKADIEQKDALQKQYWDLVAQKEEALKFKMFDRRNTWSPENQAQEKKNIAFKFDKQLIEIGGKIQTIDRAMIAREQEYKLKYEKRQVEAALQNSGVADALTAVIRKKLREGTNSDDIVRHIRAKPEMSMFDGLAGEDALRELIKEAQAKNFQAKFQELENEKGPQAKELEQMKMKEEDLRNQIDISRKGAPGKFRDPKHVTEELQKKLEDLQARITAKERAVEQEEKLTKDGYFLGDKLDRISDLFEEYLSTGKRAGIPLANPTP